MVLFVCFRHGEKIRIDSMLDQMALRDRCAIVEDAGKRDLI